MEISCEGKSRKMYNHNLFKGGIRYNYKYPLSGDAGCKYNTSKNEIEFRFYSNYLTLTGEFLFTINQSVDEVLDIIPALYVEPHHQGAAHSLVAALKMMLAEESDLSRAN